MTQHPGPNAPGAPEPQLDGLLERLAELVAAKVAARLTDRAVPERPPAPDPLLTVDQVAAALGVSRGWVYRHRKELGGERLSHKVLRFPAARVARYRALARPR